MTCPYKRTKTTDCLGRDVSRGENVLAICNSVTTESKRAEICPRFDREVMLADIKPKLFCCVEMQQLFHECAEDIGYLVGAFDIRKYPNDGKEVWRNYRRDQFVFCPFCGTQLRSKS